VPGEEGSVTSANAELERLVDFRLRAGMASEQIPGGVFILVRDGRTVLSKGYGVTNIDTGQPVRPSRPYWRIGSISKVMTAVAVVQLADRGKIELDRDVNDELKRVKVPNTFPEPITAWHLLTHTAGLDELPGRSAESREAVLPLYQFLSDRLVRVRPPGQVIAYSSYAPALAGALIEDVSGLFYEEYLEREIWQPLGMHNTNIYPDGPLPRGYDVQDGRIVEAEWEWSHTAPAGMINSTAADMGRFMNMLLGDHPDGERVLSDAARRSMLTRQITMHSAIPGVGFGLTENRQNGRVDLRARW
jgi:CubicO group peptidase (beta-lactamase class C family)